MTSSEPEQTEAVNLTLSVCVSGAVNLPQCCWRRS